MALAFDDINEHATWKIFYREMEAQYFFHCGTLILSKALKVSFYESDLDMNDSLGMYSVCEIYTVKINKLLSGKCIFIMITVQMDII